MSKGKFGPQNREIKQKVVRTKAMAGVQFQDAKTAHTSAAIVRKQNDDLVSTGKSLSLSGVKRGAYRYSNKK